MSAMPQFWILRIAGVVLAAILGICSWTLRGWPIALKKVFDDFGTEQPASVSLLLNAGPWLFIPMFVALAVVVFLFASPKSSVRHLLAGWCLLTAVAVILCVTATFLAPGLLQLIEDLI
jgi:hypothetical protein